MTARIDPTLERAIRATFRAFDPFSRIDPVDDVDEFILIFRRELETERADDARRAVGKT